MGIQSFGQQEWDALPAQKHRGATPSPEMAAVRAVQPTQGVSFPCHWRHRYSSNKNGACSGVVGAYKAAKRYGFRIHSRCVEGTVYVYRPEEKEVQ